MSSFPIPLEPDEVHIWTIALDQDPSLERGLFKYLSVDEIRRAERFHFEKHRRRFGVSHSALRQILARYLDAHPAEIQYEQTPHGKPLLSGPDRGAGIYFNLTHSHELAAVAITRNGEIGVDIEYLKKFGDIDGIAARFFSSAEQEAYLELQEEDKVTGFYNCWTRKEAFIKAIGEGLSHPLDQFDVTLMPGDEPRFLRIGEDNVEASQWTLEAFNSGEDYTGAVALRAIGVRIQHNNFG